MLFLQALGAAATEAQSNDPKCAPAYRRIATWANPAWIPLDPESIGAKEPVLYQALQDAARGLRGVDLRGYLESHPDQTLRELIDRILAERRELKKRTEVLDFNPGSRRASEKVLIEQLMSRLVASGSGAVLQKLRDSHGDLQLAKLVGLEGPVPQELLDIRNLLLVNVSDYHSRVLEALILASVKGPKALGWKAIDFLSLIRVRLKDKSNAAHLAQFNGDQTQLNKEIDVIFNDGRAWGEVKSGANPIQASGSTWKRVLKQAETLVRLQATHNQRFVRSTRRVQVVPVTELHFFAPNGIVEGAAAQLEGLGYVVHGPRVPAHAEAP